MSDDTTKKKTRRTSRRGSGDGAIYFKKGRRKPYLAMVQLPPGPDGTRRRRSLGAFKTKKEASDKLREALAEKARGMPIPEPKGLRVRDLVTRYLKYRGRSVQPSTLASYTHVFSKNVTPYIGHVPLARLSAAVVSDWLDHLDDVFAQRAGEAEARGKAAPHRKRARQAAFDLFNYACAYGVRLGVLGANPCARLTRPAVDKANVRSLSADEAGTLLQVARETQPAWVWAAVALGLGAGLRKGEVFAAQWGDLDIRSRVIHVRRALKAPAGKGQPRTLGEPKSKAAIRTVGLPGWTLEALRAHRKALDFEPLPGRLLFATASGEPVHLSNFHRRHFKPACRQAGTPWLTFHGLRHSFCALLVGSGVDFKTVQMLAGHSEGRLTIDTYGHLVPQNLSAAVATFDKLIAGNGTKGRGKRNRK